MGRQRELALLAAFLAGADEAGPDAPLLLLAGEPGIGKTRLLQAAAQQAVAQGWCVLEGGCHRRGGQEPYSPLLDALAQALYALPPERQPAALRGCGGLGRLLPELAPVLEPLPAGMLAPEQERRLMVAAVGRLLANLAGPAGTLLLLDDLQWAGPDALDLLAALVRPSFPASGGDTRPTAHASRAHAAHHAGGEGVLRIVGAYRDTEVRPDDPLGHLRADLARAGLLRHLALDPLAPDAAAELLADLLAEGAAAFVAGPATGNPAEPGEETPGMVARVLERAGGTPFFLVSYAQALRAAQHQGRAPVEPDAVPWDVAQGVRQRVALLPEPARQLLGVAAIVGRRLPWALLVTVSGQGEDAVLEGLEAAGQARLLLEDESGTYTFAHDVIREVVEADLSAARRAVLHRRVAEALERAPAGSSAELLAYHYARAGRDEKALSYLEQAGDHAWASRAHSAAEGYYRELLDRLDQRGRASDAVGAREKLAEVLYRAGRHEAVIAVLEPAAQTLQAAGEWASLARVTARIGWAYAWRGQPQEGLARLQPVLARLERDNASVPLATLYEAVGQLLLAGRYDESLAAYEHMAASARASGDDRLRALAAGHCTNLLQLLGRLGEALRVGQEALLLAEAVGAPDILRRTHLELAYLHALRGDVAAARRHGASAVTASTALGDHAERAFALSIHGWFAVLSGDWRDARADLDQALALGRQVEGPVILAYVLSVWARLSLAEGDRAPATMAVQEALALAETTGDLQALRWAAAVLAELELLEGRPDAAVACLEPLRDRTGLEEYDVTALLPILAWAYLEQGRLDEAATTVEWALARARPEQMRLVLVEALRVQALVALRQGRRLDRDSLQAAGGQSPRVEAARSLAEGLALARAMPYPYAEARLLHVAGALHAQQGEPEVARERWEAAQAIFHRLEARRDAAQVDEALASLSHPTVQSQNPPPSVSAAMFQNAPAPGNGSLRPGRTRLTEAQWAAIQALLPPPARTGRPRADDRQTLEAILYKLEAGCAWSALPVELGDGVTAYRRLRAWQAAGVWTQIQAVVHDEPTGRLQQ